MPMAVITVNDPTSVLDTQGQEVQMISRALAMADQAIRGAGGASASGTMTDPSGKVLGTWTYTAVAAP